MDLKMMLSVLAVAVFGFIGVMLLLPENIDDENPRLPWLVEMDEAGRTQAFGFTIGETTLGDVRVFFQEDGEINLFALLDADGNASGYAVEAHWSHGVHQRRRCTQSTRREEAPSEAGR